MSHLAISNCVITNMELFATTVNGFQSLTILTKSSILDVLGVLHSPVPDKWLWLDDIDFRTIAPDLVFSLLN